MAEKFLASCADVFLRRVKLLSLMNILFFGSLFFSALLSNFLYLPPPYESQSLPFLEWFLGLDWPWMILAIFLFNLVLSGFLLLTLPGLLFFPLSAVVLVTRGVLWGVMLNQQSTAVFLLMLPTMVLEGEGYAVSSMAGTLLGLSWLKPSWVYREAGLSRLGALKNAVNEASRIIFLVAVIFFLAAMVETFTITQAT